MALIEAEKIAHKSNVIDHKIRRVDRRFQDACLVCSDLLNLIEKSKFW